jgi:hypothetical protein
MIPNFKVRKGHQTRYDPTYHCALLRNRFGRITPCWGERELGRYACNDGCPIGDWWDKIKAEGKKV